MGVVYRAHDRQAGREVALKVLLNPIASPRRLERFRREGQITASLNHPGIVRVHEAGEVDGLPWLAYELVEGARTLDQVLFTQPRERSVELLRDLARALGYAHAHGIVHRDVKPSNVLLDREGRVKAADFGLATAEDLERMTQTGAFVGTPSYMSPEQIGGQRDAVGPPTDVWALGVMLYHLLAGELPFEGGSFHELATRICAGRIEPPSRFSAEVHPDLEAVCLQALAAEPAQRYPDGEVLARDLDRFLAGEPVEARRRRGGRRRLLAGAALGAGAAGLLLVAVLPSVRPAAAPEEATSLVATARITAPAEEDAPTTTDTITVRGTAPAGSTVEVQCGGWSRTARAHDGSFAVRVPLEPGENVVRARVVADEGAAGAPVSRTVVRYSLPDWFAALPEARRPPLPLADGLRFGPGPGEYENVRDGSVLVWVPPGVYRVGEDGAAVTAQLPAREHRLERGLFMGKYEVTWGQLERFCEATGAAPPARRLVGSQRSLIDGERDHEVFYADRDHPAARITYARAEAYCAWAGLRLPSELEWECAARGFEGRRYPWGDDDPGPGARLHNGEYSEDGFQFTAPVGSFPDGASPFGCLDMAGNVWEWTTDVYRAPGAGREDTAMRVIRGGAYDCSRFFCRSSYRDGGTAASESSTRGFRVCRSAE